MPTLQKQTQRLALNQSSRTGTLELLSGEKLVLWQGLAATLECALFNDTPESASMISPLNIDSANIVVRKGGPSGSILFTEDTTEFNNPSYVSWTNGTASQFTFDISELDTTQIVPASGRLPFYFVVTIVTDDAIPYIAGFGYGEIVDVGFIENPVAIDYVTGRTNIVGGKLLTDIDLNGHHFTDANIVAYQESGTLAILANATEGAVVFLHTKTASSNLRFTYLYLLTTSSNTAINVKVLADQPTSTGFNFVFSPTPNVNCTLYWKVVTKDDSEVTISPTTRYMPTNVLLGSVARPITTKLREQLSLTDFGAVGDDDTNNDIAFTDALTSDAKVIYVPEGRFKTNLTEAQLAGTRFYGPGFFAGPTGSFPNYQGPANFTRLDIAPSNGGTSLASGDYTYVNAWKFVLDGNCRHNLDAQYYNYATTPFVVEANFRSGGSGYIAKLTAGISIGATVLHLSNVDGIDVGDDIAFGLGNTFTDRHTVSAVGANTVTLSTGVTASHSIGATVLNAVRTMNQIWFGMMNQVAGGDAYIYGGQVHCFHAIPAGVTDFEENSTGGFIGGSLEAHVDGCFLTAYEFQHNDNGNDISAAGGGLNFSRSKGRFPDLITTVVDTHALYGNTWIGHYVANSGYQPLDCAYRIAGYMHVGFDFVPGIYENSCAIGLKDGNKIFFNNSAGNTRSILVGDVQGDVTMGFNSAANLGDGALEVKKGSTTCFAVVPTGIQAGGWSGIIKGCLTGSATFNPGSIASLGVVTSTVTVPGAAIGDIVLVDCPSADDPGFLIKGKVTSTNAVTVVVRNVSGGILVGTSTTFSIFVLKT